MFLHLGADVVVPLRDVITITDFKSGKSSINKEFLERMKDEKKVIDVSEKNPKSFIVTKDKVYISPLNTATVLKRAQR